MIRCVMFYFGNVLVHFNTKQWYDFVSSNRRMSPGLIEPEEFFRTEGAGDFDLGNINTTEFVRGAKSALGLNHVSDNVFLSELTYIMKPDPKMLPVVKILKQNGFKLALVSNINEHHHWYTSVTFPEVFADFNYLMLSFKRRCKKPDREMWDVPAAFFDVEPPECFFIDDLQVNIDAFERWGGVGHYYNVTDDRFCPNGRLETERNRLILRMVNLGMLSLSQAGSIVRIDF